MRTAVKLSLGWVLRTLLVGTIGGVQLGLYLADWYDDGVAEPLSGWIGVGILGAAAVVAVRPFLRSARGGQDNQRRTGV